MGDVGAVASAIEYLLRLFVEEDKFPEAYKRWKGAALRKKADQALLAGDMDLHARILSELERLSDKP